MITVKNNRECGAGAMLANKIIEEGLKPKSLDQIMKQSSPQFPFVVMRAVTVSLSGIFCSCTKEENEQGKRIVILGMVSATTPSNPNPARVYTSPCTCGNNINGLKAYGTSKECYVQV